MSGLVDALLPEEGIDSPLVSIVIIGWGSAPHLLDCVRSIERIDTSVPHEVIVTLNEPTADLLAALSQSGVDARVVSSRVNRGFGGACNAAARVATGDYVLFLNDDTLVDRGWLEPLVATAEARSDIGAVGSLCLHMDGTVQEAGNFLWSDGTTSSSTLDEPGLPHCYDWARAVDYCSGASLLVRRSTWNLVRGFDEIYYPAYYEDLDLCLKIQALGQQVWFQPASVVHHVRSASTTRPYREFLMHRHREILKEQWKDVLDGHVERTDDRVRDEEVATWLGMGRPDRLLVIDDRLPDASLGAGFGRMADALAELFSDPAYFISFFPSASSEGDWSELSRRGLRVLHGDLASHLRHPGTRYDAVIISRPHNYGKFGTLVRESQPDAAVIYDAEALYFRRLEIQARLAGDMASRSALRAEAGDMRDAEESYFADADHVVCISEEEAAFARTLDETSRVHVIPAHLAGLSQTTATFEERRDVIFVSSWLPGADSPNGDGLTWFVTSVLPLLRERVPWVRLRVTGANPPSEMLSFESPNVRFEGRVDDLRGFYRQARVAISPTRYGAGVKLKTMEALQLGVPVVATTVGGEGIETFGTEALLVTDDPREFAETVASLVDDRESWEVQRRRISELQRHWEKVGKGGTTWKAVMKSALEGRGSSVSPDERASA